MESWRRVAKFGAAIELDVRNFVQRALFEGAPPPENIEKTTWPDFF